MNPDQTTIQSAYEDAIKRVYGVLLDNYGQANGDPAKEQAADQRFAKGIAVARKARERAISLLA